MAMASVGMMEKSTFGEGEVERAEVITRYRRLRELSRKHGDAILKRLPKKIVLDWGKRVGLVRRKTFIASSIEEMALAFDLERVEANEIQDSLKARYVILCVCLANIEC